MKKFYLFLTVLVSIAILGLGAPSTSMATYPDRPITLIIPFGPGGAADTAARVLSQFFAEKFGVTLQIVCKAGGAGAPAMLDVARARPDGYTYGFISTLPFVTTPQMKKTGYSLDSFEPVGFSSIVWLSLAVRADSGIKNFNDFLEDAKKNPKKHNFATHGALSAQRLLMASIMANYPDVQIPHIAYASGHEASTALLGSHVTSTFGVPTNHLPYVRSGDFRLIGVSSPERLPDLPDVPTFKEQVGTDKNDFVLATHQAVIAPKGTPVEAMEKFQSMVEEILLEPEYIEKARNAGISADYGSAADLKKHLDDSWNFVGNALKTIEFK